MSETATGWGEQKIRVGVVGLGFTGTTHIECYRQLSNVEVVALAGMEEVRLAQMGVEYHIPHLYRHYEDLLERDDLDIVSICTPNNLHLPIALGALERNCHVLCEKPLARSTAEAEAMVAAARKADRALETVFNHRARNDVVTLKRYIDEVGLGEIYHARAGWMRRSGIPTIGSWFTSKEMAGGGPLIDLGVHMLDIALYLLGEPEVAAVSAATYARLGPRGRGGSIATGLVAKQFVGSSYEVEDMATAFIRLASGATLLLEASWAVYGPYGDDFGVLLFGDDGGAEIKVLNYNTENTLTIFTDAAGRPATLHPQVSGREGHQRIVTDFVDRVRAGDWSGYQGEEGLKRARIIEACYTSAESGREIRLNGD